MLLLPLLLLLSFSLARVVAAELLPLFLTMLENSNVFRGLDRSPGATFRIFAVAGLVGVDPPASSLRADLGVDFALADAMIRFGTCKFSGGTGRCGAGDVDAVTFLPAAAPAAAPPTPAIGATDDPKICRALAGADDPNAALAPDFLGVRAPAAGGTVDGGL